MSRFSSRQLINNSAEFEELPSESSQPEPRGHLIGRDSSHETNSDFVHNEDLRSAPKDNTQDIQTTTHQISLRRTSNPNQKTTKTGKILHKSKRIGVNTKPTAYNRFLQQRSKFLAEHHSEMTPQQ
ncbi:hypothetical protein BG011_006789, partial [Mortierella polycephala]